MPLPLALILAARNKSLSATLAGGPAVFAIAAALRCARNNPDDSSGAVAGARRHAAAPPSRGDAAIASIASHACTRVAPHSAPAVRVTSSARHRVVGGVVRRLRREPRGPHPGCDSPAARHRPRRAAFAIRAFVLRLATQTFPVSEQPARRRWRRGEPRQRPARVVVVTHLAGDMSGTRTAPRAAVCTRTR